MVAPHEIAKGSIEPGFLFEVNTHYVFHRRRAAGEITWSDIVQRLKSHNVQILKAPKGPEDLAYPYIGGPLYRIEFAHGKHRGVIYNEVDTKIAQDDRLAKDWFLDDLILVYLQ